MPTDSPVFTLAQWFSPAYPVGAFAYSHGLEWAVEAGDVTGAGTARDWVATVLEHGAGWNDALLLNAAYRAASAAEVSAVDDTARALSASAERLQETRLQGAAFAGVTGAVWAHDLPDLTYPVAVGRAARLLRLPRGLTTNFYLQAFMSNLVAAATRLVPLGQTEAQRLVRDLTPLCRSVARAAGKADLSQLNATAFAGDIAAMQHETQYSRIFRT